MTESTLVDRLAPGDHVCWTVDDDAELTRVLGGYVRGGVAADHKVVYLAHARTPEETADELRAEGLDVDALVAASALEIHEGEPLYLAGGSFDPDRMIAQCEELCTQARAEGFSGVRLAGDMGWAARPVAGGDRLVEYEAAVTRVYAEGFAIGLCLYDRRLFHPAVLARLSAAHPAGARPGDRDDWHPQLRLHRDGDGSRLMVSGEADVANGDALIALLDAVRTGADGAPAVLDVGHLDFVDVRSVRALVATAARLGGLHIVGASPLLRRLLDFVGAAAVPGLVVHPREDVLPVAGS